MFVVFDLDGTMFDGSHKAGLLLPPDPKTGIWPKQDFTAWIAACENDVLIEHVAETARALIAAGHKVEFWTGRGEDCREPTQRALDKHGFGGLELVMRPPSHGTTPDHVVKAQYLARGKPDLIFEDKQSVVDMWRWFGIPVCQVEAPKPQAAAAGGTLEKAA